MIKNLNYKELNAHLEAAGLPRAVGMREVQRSLGNEYVMQPPKMGGTERVKLKRINSVLFGGV